MYDISVIMATTFYSKDASSLILARIACRLEEKSVTDTRQCKIWQGEKDRNGYGILRLTVAGKGISFTVHRLAYFVGFKSKLHLQPEVHVSHCCHNKVCINVEHLSYEGSGVNNARNICRLNMTPSAAIFVSILSYFPLF